MEKTIFFKNIFGEGLNIIISKNKNIIVPHIHMHERSFVLVPLCDIIPNHIHPVFKTSVIDLSKKVNKNNISKYVI